MSVESFTYFFVSMHGNNNKMNLLLKFATVFYIPFYSCWETIFCSICMGSGSCSSSGGSSSKRSSGGGSNSRLFSCCANILALVVAQVCFTQLVGVSRHYSERKQCY